MSTLADIKSAIQNMSKAGNGNAKDMIFTGAVVEVLDETISAEDESGILYSGIRTCAITDGDDNNLRIYPSVGADVVVLDITGDRRDMIAVLYSKIDKITIHGGTESVPNGTELKTQLETLSERVQTLYDALNGAGVDGQLGILKSDVVKKLATQTKKEDFSKIEDLTLKH